jgi:hypothetical protein
MLKFMRYGSRHRIHFPRGYQGRYAPQINPTSSSSHGANRKPTISFHEPLWFFHARKRLFAFAGAHRCPERGGSLGHGRFPDSWNLMPDGNRTCSYCGSIHPEDMQKLVQRCIDTDGEEASIEPTDKNYKCYVRQRGVVNASQGAIKFYMWHVTPEMLLPHSQEAYGKACRISNAAHQRKMEEFRAGGFKK